MFCRFLVSIYDQERAEMLDQLRRARFISVCIDGATDTGKLENEIVYVKFWNDKMGVLQCFLGIEDVKFANADGVIQAIDTVFKEAGIPDWREKIVFLAADGASVNMGKKNGVAAKLRREVEYLLAIHCIAHRLELGVNDAVRENPQLKRLQEVLVYLYEQYDYSPKALRELRMLGEALEEKVLKPTTLKGARWLPYIHRATKILCTSYKVFVAHFEDMVSSERRPQPSATVMGRAMNILRYLKDAKNLQFMHFWCDALEVLKILSEQFQRDNLTPGEAVQYQEACCAGLIELSLQPGVEQSKVIGSITSFSKYQGVELTNISADTLKKEREEITETMIDHLQKRLGDLYSNSVISKFRALDHTLWPELDNDKHSKEAFVLHGRDQIGGLVEHYEEVFKRHGVDPGSVLHQFRLYKTWAKNCQTSMRNTLITVPKIEDLKKRFDALAILMEIYVVMSVSTAMCERGFSCMKRVKSDWRSSLTTIQVNRLMYISLEGPTCDKFVALNSVNYWWGAAVRKPGFTAWKQRIEQPTDEELERELEEIDREMEASRDAEDAARERLNHVTESKEDKEGVDREATEDA
ncbi:zinc finger protein 862-like [Oryzias latipes]